MVNARVTSTTHLVSNSTSDIFDNYYHLKSVDVPVMIIHGIDDTIIPISHGRNLNHVCQSSRICEISGMGHNDVFTGRTDRVFGAMRAVIDIDRC